MWCLLGQRVHWVCDEGEIDVTGLRVRAVTGTPRMDEDLSVMVGRALAALDRSVDFETLLLLEAQASTVEPILEGLRLARWSLRRLITASGSVLLEGSRRGGRRLSTWKMEDGSLEAAVPCLLERQDNGSILVDPFAFDLRSLRAAEMAGLHSISIISSAGISRHIGQASGFSLKVEVPSWSWVPAFLLHLRQLGEIQEAANKSRVSPARVYQAMKREKGFRLAVNAVRTGIQVGVHHAKP